MFVCQLQLRNRGPPVELDGGATRSKSQKTNSRANNFRHRAQTSMKPIGSMIVPSPTKFGDFTKIPERAGTGKVEIIDTTAEQKMEEGRQVELAQNNNITLLKV